MNRTLHFEGSHGGFTACAVSGHIIQADDCSCDDCQRLGSYRSIALVDITALDPVTLSEGGGDILAAALIWRDGGYSLPCGWIADRFEHWDELPRLPAPESVQ